MNRRLTDAANFKLRMQDKNRQQDEDYRTIQDGRKLSKEADRLDPDVERFVKEILNLRLRLVHAQARLNGELATKPINIRKMREAIGYVSDLCTVLRARNTVCDDHN